MRLPSLEAATSPPPPNTHPINTDNNAPENDEFIEVGFEQLQLDNDEVGIAPNGDSNKDEPIGEDPKFPQNGVINQIGEYPWGRYLVKDGLSAVDDQINPSSSNGLFRCSSLDFKPGRSHNNDDCSDDSDSSDSDDDDDSESSFYSSSDDDDDDDDDDPPKCKKRRSKSISRSLKETLKSFCNHFHDDANSSHFQALLYAEKSEKFIIHDNIHKSDLIPVINSLINSLHQLQPPPETILEILLPMFQTPLETTFQPNYLTNHSEITFQLFLRFLDQDLDIDTARGQFESHTMRRSLFSSLEDTFIPTFPELSFAIYNFLDRYSNTAPPRYGFNVPQYTLFGLYLQEHYMMNEDIVLKYEKNEKKLKRLEKYKTNNYFDDGYAAADDDDYDYDEDVDNGSYGWYYDDCYNPIEPELPKIDYWSLYKPSTDRLRPPKIIPVDQDVLNLDDIDVDSTDDYGDDDYGDDDDLDGELRNVGVYDTFLREQLIKTHMERRIQRQIAIDIENEKNQRRKEQNNEIHFVNVLPEFNKVQVKGYFGQLLQILRKLHRKLLKKLQLDEEKLNEINFKMINLGNFGQDLDQAQNAQNKIEKLFEEHKRANNLLEKSNSLQTNLLFQLFIVPYPLRTAVHLTMSRESWIYSIRFALSHTHPSNITNLFKSYHFLHHFILLGTTSLILGPKQSSSVCKYNEVRAEGNGDEWRYQSDLGLLDLTYVNTMTRFWVQFSSDDGTITTDNRNNSDNSDNSDNPTSATRSSQKKDIAKEEEGGKKRVLIDNGAEMVAAVIDGFIEAIFEYEL